MAQIFKFGFEDAFDEGKAEGMAKGKAEERSKIALNMLKGGETDAKICRITGLTRKELQLLKRSLKN